MNVVWPESIRTLRPPVAREVEAAMWVPMAIIDGLGVSIPARHSV